MEKVRICETTYDPFFSWWDCDHQDELLNLKAQDLWILGSLLDPMVRSIKITIRRHCSEIES